MKIDARHYSSPGTADPVDRLIPCEQLFIYYLDGRADTHDLDLGAGFLGNWEESDSSFLFFSTPAENEIHKLIEKYPPLKLVDTFEMPYQEWQPLEAFPLEAGGFTIYPPWIRPIPETDTRNLVLDPGLVFGSGFHATTHDCLEALEFICYNNIKTIETAVDIGTGSGLLAIAAALKGVPEVIGVDNNFLAAKTAAHNVAINHANDRVMIIYGSALEPVWKSPDLLMANIHFEVMESIVCSPVFRESEWFILSGLLRTPAEKITNRLKNLSTDIINIWNSDKIWYTVLGKNR